MLLEQETASIMAFALHHAGNPNPYYCDVPEGFVFPAMYFPQPEIDTSGETFKTYAMQYHWYITVLDETTEKAYEKAWSVLTELKKSRNMIPLLDDSGIDTGDNLRLDDPSIKIADVGAVNIMLSWTSCRPYNTTATQKMVDWDANIFEHI